MGTLLNEFHDVVLLCLHLDYGNPNKF